MSSKLKLLDANAHGLLSSMILINIFMWSFNYLGIENILSSSCMSCLVDVLHEGKKFLVITPEIKIYRKNIHVKDHIF